MRYFITHTKDNHLMYELPTDYTIMKSYGEMAESCYSRAFYYIVPTDQVDTFGQYMFEGDYFTHIIVTEADLHYETSIKDIINSNKAYSIDIINMNEDCIYNTIFDNTIAYNRVSIVDTDTDTTEVIVE